MASNNTNNITEKCVQWDFLVKVSGNCLELNPDALKLPVGTADGSTPVVILSVVGEPKSGKTFLMNRIISYFRQCFHPSGRHHPECPNMHGHEGVLVWVYPEWIQRSDDTWTALLLMDIHMQNPRGVVYTKLVDFCISLSSTVIFSVPCGPNANVYWQPSCSSLSLGSTDLTTFLQLHFFVLTKHPSLDLYVTYSSEEVESSSEQLKKKFGSITPAAEFLSSRCKVITLTRIPLHGNEGDLSTCHWNHPELELFKKILKSSINSHVDINTASVNVSNIYDWLQQSILALNTSSSASQIHKRCTVDTVGSRRAGPMMDGASLRNEVAHTLWHFREEGYVKSTASFSSHSLEHRYDPSQIHQDVEMKSCVSESTGTSQRKQEPQEFGDYARDEAEYNRILQKTSQEMVFLQDKIEAELKKELSRNPHNFTNMVLENFQNLYDPKIYGIPNPFREQITQKLFHSAKDRLGTLGKMNEMINAYIEYMKMHFRVNIYLDSFETVHEESLRRAKSTTSYRDSGRKSLDDLYRETIENLKKGLEEQNKRVYSLEDEISKKAFQHAVQKFKDFMQEKMSTSVLTQLELKEFHDLARKTISTVFLKALKGKSTPPWINQHDSLNKSLESSLSYYDNLRQDQVRIITTDGFAAGRACYQGLMKTWLPETRVTDGNLADCHNRAEREALVKVKSIVKSKEVPQNIGKELEDEFKGCLSDLRQQFSIENHYKREQSASYSASPARPAVTGRTAPSHESHVVHSQKKPYGIGIYIAPTQVCVGVCHEQLSLEDIISLEPCIYFAEGNAYIEQEARGYCDAVRYNIFHLLSTHPNISIEDTLEGKEIGEDEILAIFFHRVRMTTEMRLKQKVTSCNVAITGLLSSGAKQMLKTALVVAGFQENTLMPFTTTMAMSYILKSRDQTPLSENCYFPILLIYADSKSVEIASADVTSEEATIKTLSGVFKHSYNWEKRLKRLLDTATLPGKKYGAVVLCGEDDMQDPWGDARWKEIVKCFHTRAPTEFSAREDILTLAAAGDALKKGYHELLPSRFRFPAYQNVSPYRIRVGQHKKSHTFVDFNFQIPIPGTRGVQDYKAGKVTVQESAGDSRKDFEIATYELEISVHPTTRLLLNLHQEGNLTVGTDPEDLPIKIHSRSLLVSGHEKILESIKPLLVAQEERHGFKVTVRQDQKYSVVRSESPPPQISSAESTNRTEELLQSVKVLVEKVKVELEKSKTTTVTVRENIESKIQRCEEFLMKNAAEVKVLPLQVATSNLERAAKLIKI